jgi:hypothetical protein
MDIDALRKHIQQRFNPLQTKVEKSLSEAVVKSEPEDPIKSKSMLQQALENRLQSEQESVPISESDRMKLRQTVDGLVDMKLLNRLLKGHD